MPTARRLLLLPIALLLGVATAGAPVDSDGKLAVGLPTGLDPEVAQAAEGARWTLERVREQAVGGASVATAVYAAPLGAGAARVVLHDELGAGGREVEWLQPEREYHDGWLTVGATEARRDGCVALEVAVAILSHFRGVPGTTLNLWEHPSEPYRFWVSIELAPGDGRQRPAQLFGGTLTVLDGRLRLLDAVVRLRPAQLEALAGLALERKAAGLRVAALGVRTVDAREVEPPFWPPAEVVLVTTAQGSIEEVDTAWLETLRLEQSGHLRRIDEGCIQRMGSVETAPERSGWLLGDAEVRLLRPRGPWCLTGAGPADHEPARVLARGERYRVVLGELER